MRGPAQEAFEAIKKKKKEQEEKMHVNSFPFSFFI